MVTYEQHLHTVDNIVSKAADDLAMRIRQVKRLYPTAAQQQVELELLGMAQRLDTMQYAS